MRKLICFFATIITVFSLFGCSVSPIEEGNSVVFYYIHNEIEYGTDSGVITPAVVNVNVKPDNYDALLTLYFNGPTNYECISPFAAGTTFVELGIANNKAQITLSPHMATLDNSTLTVALACLTRTIVEMTGVDTVQIRIQNSKIYGEESVTLSLNSFAYFDDVMPGAS